MNLHLGEIAPGNIQIGKEKKKFGINPPLSFTEVSPWGNSMLRKGKSRMAGLSRSLAL